jgi:hypothetical protein
LIDPLGKIPKVNSKYKKMMIASATILDYAATRDVFVVVFSEG